MHMHGKSILIAGTFAAAIIGYGIPTSANADDPRAKLESLLTSADRLYNDAALIVSKHPTTQGAVMSSLIQSGNNGRTTRIPFRIH
jgi:hypothetical protein